MPRTSASGSGGLIPLRLLTVSSVLRQCPHPSLVVPRPPSRVPGRDRDPFEGSVMPNPLSTKVLAELIGTFAFVFIGAGAAAVVGDGAGLNGIVAIAFAHGLTIMVFAFAYGSLSGAHMNPAVTIGVLAAGAIRLRDVLGYIVIQLAGGIAGSLLLRAVLCRVATALGTPPLAHGLVLGATTVTI